MAQALRNPSRQRRLPSANNLSANNLSANNLSANNLGANNLGAIDLSGITELQAITKKGAFAPFLYRGAESRQRIRI